MRQSKWLLPSAVISLTVATCSAAPQPPPPIPAGVDEFESTAEVTLRLFEDPVLGIPPGFEETIHLVPIAPGVSDTIIQRGPHDPVVDRAPVQLHLEVQQFRNDLDFEA